MMVCWSISKYCCIPLYMYANERYTPLQIKHEVTTAALKTCLWKVTHTGLLLSFAFAWGPAVAWATCEWLQVQLQAGLCCSIVLLGKALYSPMHSLSLSIDPEISGYLEGQRRLVRVISFVCRKMAARLYAPWGVEVTEIQTLQSCNQHKILEAVIVGMK